MRISLDPSAAEAAQIARAADTPAQTQADARSAAIADLALIAGTDRSAIRADDATRTLFATATALPGLELAGYRALERRADRVLDPWQLRLAPPTAIEPPEVTVIEGVVDGRALDLAGWASQRLARAISVLGGSAAQRRAVADGIIARGGQARAGASAGRLRLTWEEPTAAPTKPVAP